MHMDGAALYAATYEINEQLLDGRIERIGMPNRNDCILTFRAQGKNHRLLISTCAGRPNRARNSPLYF